MSTRMVISSQSIQRDAEKFTQWSSSLATAWSSVQQQLDSIDYHATFGSPISGIAQFVQTFKDAVAALGSYVAGDSTSGVSALADFSSNLSLAATTYDQARATVQQELSTLQTGAGN